MFKNLNDDQKRVFWKFAGKLSKLADDITSLCLLDKQNQCCTQDLVKFIRENHIKTPDRKSSESDYADACQDINILFSLPGDFLEILGFTKYHSPFQYVPVIYEIPRWIVEYFPDGYQYYGGCDNLGRSRIISRELFHSSNIVERVINHIGIPKEDVEPYVIPEE